MTISTRTASVPDIAPLRDFYRQEMNCQIIHDSLHSRPGWTQSYLLLINDSPVGYGAIAISGPWKEKPTIFEFYVLPQQRSRLFDLFSALVEAAGTTLVETQTNDALLSTLLHALAPTITSDSILFHDKLTTTLIVPGTIVRPITSADSPPILANDLDADAQWLLEFEGQIAGTGGILYHYNPPYADLYMKIAAPFRRRGLGSYMVQELKRICHNQGHIPAARCNPANLASRQTLQKAGFVPCGNRVTGSVVAVV